MNDRSASADRAIEAWRRTLVTMRSEEMDELLTPDEETQWLSLVAGNVVDAPLSLRALTRQDVLDRLAVVLARSRGNPWSGVREHDRRRA